MCYCPGVYIIKYLLFKTLSEKWAHSTVYPHLREVWTVFIQLDWWLRWWYTFEWVTFSESVNYMLYLLENKLIFQKGSVIGAYFLIGAYFWTANPQKAHLRFYLTHKTRILTGIFIGAYFSSESECKTHVRLFSMGAYLWIGAYFPVNTVLQVVHAVLYFEQALTEFFSFQKII